MKTSFCKTFKSLPAFNFYESKLEGKTVAIHNKKVKVIVLGVFIGLLTLGFGGYLSSRLLATHYILKKLRKMDETKPKEHNIEKNEYPIPSVPFLTPNGFPALTKEQIKIVDEFVVKPQSDVVDLSNCMNPFIKELITRPGSFHEHLPTSYKDLLKNSFPHLSIGPTWVVCVENIRPKRSDHPSLSIDKGMIVLTLDWGGHASVVTIDLNNKTLTSFDSWSSYEKQEVMLKKLRTWFQTFRNERTIENWKIEIPKNIPLQLKHDQCVLYTMIYLRFLAEGRKLNMESFTPEHLKYFRYLFAYELIQKKILI